MSAIFSSTASTVPLLQLAQSRFGQQASTQISNTLSNVIPATADSASQTAANNMTGATLLSALNQSALLNGGSIIEKLQGVRTSAAERKLQQPPFAPQDVNMFTTGIYPEGTPEVPAAPKGNGNLGGAKAAYPNILTRTMQTRFGVGTDDYNKALAVYDDPELHQLTALRDANGQPILDKNGNVKFNQRLMTSLALLTGSAGEGSINEIKNGPYARIAFGEPSNPGFLAESRSITGTNYNEILINDKFKYEDPRLISPLLAHESLHQDPGQFNNSNREELMANTVEAAIYGQFVAESPGLARQGTELSRNENTKLMGLLNTRDADGHINILEPAQGPIFPGSSVTDIQSFGEGFTAGGLGPNTPGNGSLDSVLSSLSGQTVSGANFDDASLNTLNESVNNALAPEEWLRVARALKLDLSKPKA